MDDRYRTPEAIFGDLLEIVRLAEFHGVETPITALTGGVLVAGSVTPTADYLSLESIPIDLFIQQQGEAIRHEQDIEFVRSDSLRDYSLEMAKRYRSEVERHRYLPRSIGQRVERQVLQENQERYAAEPVEWLHLKNVTIAAATGTISIPIWRAKIDRVDGWSIGRAGLAYAGPELDVQGWRHLLQT